MAGSRAKFLPSAQPCSVHKRNKATGFRQLRVRGQIELESGKGCDGSRIPPVTASLRLPHHVTVDCRFADRRRPLLPDIMAKHLCIFSQLLRPEK